MKKSLVAFVAAACIAGASSAQAADIVQIAAGDPNFSTLVAAVQAADLADDLGAPNGPYTVFAPTNAAFDALPPGTVGKLLDNQDLLIKLLTYHVVSGSVFAADVVELDSATTLQGEMVKITATPAGVRVNNAAVTTTDIVADNGVIHVIDRVLLPKGFVGELNRR